MGVAPAVIRAHLQAQYDAWAAMLYPDGFGRTPARVEIAFADGTSGYDTSGDVIVIFVADGNIDDFNRRVGHILALPDRHQLCINEIELLHEMMHERQHKEMPSVTTEGAALHDAHKYNFAGPGHDAVFFSAIAISAPLLGLDASTLVKTL